MLRLIALLSLLATPAAALDVCDDLWLTRNLVFDRAGYCFGSALGQAVFDNSDCTTKSPVLSKADKTLISDVKEVEAEWDCAIDTARVSLNVEALTLRLSVRTIPIADGYESSCIGWRGQDVALHSGASHTAPVIGSFGRAANILFQHRPVNGFDYVSIYENNQLRGMGWARFQQTPEACDGWAG